MTEPRPAADPSGTTAPGQADLTRAGRLFTPAFLALTVAELAYFTSDGVTIPLTPLFASGPLGADDVGVGITYGAFSVTALVLRPVAGRLADRRGRRPLLVGGAALFAIALALHPLAPTLAVLVGLRLLLGIGEAFFFVAGFAMLADLAPPGRTGEALSFNSLALYLGIALGPTVGELLLDAGGFTLAWLGGAGLAAVAAVLAVTMAETAPARGADRPPSPLVHRAAIGPSSALFTGVAGMAGLFAFVTLHARDLGLDGSRGVLLLFGLVVVGCRVVFAKLPDRVPPFALGSAALGLVAAGLLVIGLIQVPAALYGGATMVAIGVAFITPAFFGAIIARVDRAERGTALATASIFLDLAFGGGPVLVGIVAALGGISLGFVAAAALAGIGSAGSAVAAIRRRPVPA